MRMTVFGQQLIRPQQCTMGVRSRRNISHAVLHTDYEKVGTVTDCIRRRLLWASGIENLGSATRFLCTGDKGQQTIISNQ
ncbi:hypothetical protein TGDOM2_306692 [Toxoplasma gondii GAB2-2007-GAL-DOM2]|uniref:Uncharacterized protein n=3 Tax=Toxoplasma gondii TaxID=5811 RepID=S7VR11_TOXGG|nr:hypothetical protein TGGT1_306692 [Toxoplasma gondii GT1]KFG33651.1 hypothetical protein TGDOM2_306692 [Toxoplasma gondii GAB2-2007-GAL-DOM2]KFG44767.1 hypothetical protein TGFOU_306692 [Toxoplasma gondii FOU]